MHYILNEEEFKNVVSRDHYEAALRAIVGLREKLLYAQGFVCIYKRLDDPTATCDKCPVGGPRNDWSSESALYCDLPKNYSQ